MQQTAEDHAQILFGGRHYRQIDARCWSPQHRIRDMDAEGVETQVVSPVPVTLCHGEPADGAGVLARAQNDFFAELVAAAPDRLAALGAVPLQDPDHAAAELTRCVDELGFLGVEIGTRVGDIELGDPVLDPFFDAAAAANALVLIHPVDTTLDSRLGRLGVTFGVGMPTETAVAAAGLLTAETVARRPELRLCLAHGGGALPGILPRIDRGWSSQAEPNTGREPPSTQASQMYCDSLTYDPECLLLAIHRFGADHVLLGTDYPFAARETPAGAALDGTEPRLSPQTREAIAHENALELMGAVTHRPVVRRSEKEMSIDG